MKDRLNVLRATTKKSCLLLIGMLLFLGNKEVYGQGNQRNSYDPLELGCLPVGMWVTPPEKFLNDAEYKRMAMSGINFVNGFGYHERSNGNINKALDLCHKYGLKYFVNRSDARKTILAYDQNKDESVLLQFISDAKLFAAHPAYAGELLLDEPGKDLIPTVAEFTSHYEKTYPDKMWHVNLFPTYATIGIKTHSYEDYIDTWLDATNPRYLSYDSYPLLTDGTIIDDYYYNLDLIRSKTLDRKIPFWTFVQTLSIARTPEVPDKKDPNEVDIRWQVWANLAFGAKGIQYFCYWTPASTSEDFGDALIGLDGKATARYKYVKKLNTDIKKAGEILLHCDAVGVIQTSPNPFPLYGIGLSSFGPILSVSGDDNIVGCFKDEDGQLKALIAPLLPGKSATVVLELDTKVKSVNIISDKKEREVKVKKQQLKHKIAAGDAVLIEF